MKNISVRLKITWWFFLILALVVTLTFVTVLHVSESVLQKTIRDTLIVTVESNADEFSYVESPGEVGITQEGDIYIEYLEGYLVVDDDFLDRTNEISTALYHQDNTLIYGENPIYLATADMAFRDTHIQTLEVDGVSYYVMDRSLALEGLEGLWIRGVVSEKQGTAQLSSIVDISLVLLPLLFLLAVLGGFLIAGRVLRPVNRISEAAEQINHGNDLKKRIEMPPGNDEFHRLAGNFNAMLDRLDRSFETEKQFTSDASHELRTPMAVIMAQCEYTLEEPREAEEYRETLEVIQRQGRKMSRLISDMLNFTRIEQRGRKIPFENFDLSGLVSSVCEDMALVGDKNIVLTSEIQKGITLSGNMELMSRLVINLITNTYRYGKENGNTHVTLENKDGHIHLSVRDDGIGIAEENLEKIFDRFYQGDASRSGEGTGLGLSMVREIAVLHGGDVTVESVLGEGSTFTVRLPL